MLIDPNVLKSDLKTNVVEVIFTKINGETRKMRATLDPRHIPELAKPEHHPGAMEQLLLEEGEPAKTIAVWDIDAGGWRSFRTDRVISVQGLQVY